MAQPGDPRADALYDVLDSDGWPEFMKIVAQEAKSARAQAMSADTLPEIEAGRTKFSTLKVLITKIYNLAGESLPPTIKDIFE